MAAKLPDSIGKGDDRTVWSVGRCVVTCQGREGGRDVAPLILPEDVNDLTLAFVDVAADLLVRLVAGAGGTHAREAAESVAALTAGAVLCTHATTC